jgi:AcrR family transcriptional regulator
MRQIATPECDDDVVVDLTPAQVVALAALAGGGSVSDAADAAGVHRATLYRWLDSDPVFVAERNRLQAEQRARINAQVGDLVGISLDFIRDIITGEKLVAPALRVKAALAVLQRAGALEPDPVPGPTDPDDVRVEWGPRATVRKLYRTPEP